MTHCTRVLHFSPFVCLLFLFIPNLGNGTVETPRPILYAALGDSISAAMLANTSLMNLTQDQASMTEDEAVQEIDAQSLIENKKTFSWASGLEIKSHYTYIQAKFNPEPIVVKNLAVPGVTSRGLKNQVSKLLKAVKSQSFQEVRYVTLMIGANDVCAYGISKPTLDPEFEANVYHAIEQIALIKQNAPVHLLISAIPRIPDLGSKPINERKTLGSFTCARFRKILNLCQNLIGWTTEEEYKASLKRVEEKNQILKNVADRASQEFKNLVIHFTSRPFEEAIHPDQLALDCFHPNQKGQQSISNVLWKEQPWF